MATSVSTIFNQSIDYLSQSDVFYGHGVAIAEDEVVLLLMHVLAVDFHTLNQMSDHPISHDQQRQINELLQRRVKHRQRRLACEVKRGRVLVLRGLDRSLTRVEVEGNELAGRVGGDRRPREVRGPRRYHVDWRGGRGKQV